MGRDFDGVDDNVSYGSDASIDAFTAKTVMFWIVPNTGASNIDAVVAKGPGGYFDTWSVNVDDNGGSDRIRLAQDFATTDGDWASPGGSITDNGIFAVTVTHDGTTSAPTIYINGASQSITTITAPAGAMNSDAAGNLRAGTTGDGTGGPYTGKIGHLVYHNAVLSAADANRHRWWGCAPGGPSTVKVWQPMWTSDLSNRGTATANGTATGTTMDNASLPRVERCWGSMMGVGR